MPLSRPAALLATGMLVAVLLVMVCLPVSAQTAREQAGLLGSQAQEHCLAGRHAEALKLYNEAFRLRPHPRRDYYFGIEHQHLDHPVEADDAFERYLKVPGGEPEYVADAISRRNELKPKIGEIELSTSERDVEVLVDGQPRERGPDGRFKVRTGLRRVLVRKSGFESFAAGITVGAGERTTVSVSLRARPVEAALQPARGPDVLAADPAPQRWRDGEFTVVAGGGLWREVGENATTPAFVLGGSYRLAGNTVQLRAGARATLGTFIDVGKNDLALGLLAAPILRYARGPAALAICFEVGGGVTVLSGVQPGSRLLKSTAREVTGALTMLAVRPALTLEYPFTPAWAVLVSGSATFGRAPNNYFVDRSLTRFDLGAGLSVRF